MSSRILIRSCRPPYLSLPAKSFFYKQLRQQSWWIKSLRGKLFTWIIKLRCCQLLLYTCPISGEVSSPSHVQGQNFLAPDSIILNPLQTWIWAMVNGGWGAFLLGKDSSHQQLGSLGSWWGHWPSAPNSCCDEESNAVEVTFPENLSVWNFPSL